MHANHNEVKDSPISLVLNDSSRLQQGSEKARFEPTSEVALQQVPPEPESHSRTEAEVWVVQTTTEWAAQNMKDAMPEAEARSQHLPLSLLSFSKALTALQHDAWI